MASVTFPASSMKRLILAWPSMRVTGSMTMRFDINLSTKFQLQALELWRFAIQDLDHDGLDAVGWRRTAGQVIFHLDGFMHRHHAFEQRGQNALGLRHARIVLGVLDIGALEHIFVIAQAKLVAYGRKVAGDGAVA